MSSPPPDGQLDLGALGDLSPDLDPALLDHIINHFRTRAANRLRDQQGTTPSAGSTANGGHDPEQSTPKMTSSTSTATPVKHSFGARVASLRSPKSDINAVILDYLTMEGYPKAAANFAKEANLPVQQNESSIAARQEIQTYIHRGDLKAAIESLNDLDPEILGKNPPLHFALLRLQLVELIRESNGTDIADVIKFAQEQLGPRAPARKEFVEDLEQTMSLLFFSADNMPAVVERLLHTDLRREVADNVNKAILEHQSQRREAAIRNLVRLRAWAEITARSRKVELPSRIEIGFNGDDFEDEQLGENGHEPMVTT